MKVNFVKSLDEDTQSIFIFYQFKVRIEKTPKNKLEF